MATSLQQRRRGALARGEMGGLGWYPPDLLLPGPPPRLPRLRSGSQGGCWGVGVCVLCGCTGCVSRIGARDDVSGGRALLVEEGAPLVPWAPHRSAGRRGKGVRVDEGWPGTPVGSRWLVGGGFRFLGCARNDNKARSGDKKARSEWHERALGKTGRCAGNGEWVVAARPRGRPGMTKMPSRIHTFHPEPFHCHPERSRGN